jgi:hypothetical protein
LTLSYPLFKVLTAPSSEQRTSCFWFLAAYVSMLLAHGVRADELSTGTAIAFAGSMAPLFDSRVSFSKLTSGLRSVNYANPSVRVQP